ncbi:MAG: hypothetical protein QG674_439 [Patescibacteria group bacterium]|jgi:hypothetical protein|nr:hypothetical protein [Patescibacteria group bacterium]
MKKTTYAGDALGSPGIICGSEDRLGIFIGIHFGFDVVEEHQKGLFTIWKELGVPYENFIPENFGLKLYTVTKFPKDRFFFEKGETHTCLTFESGTEPLKGWKNEELENTPEQMATAWDDTSFGVVVSNQYSDYLKELYEAFERKDVMVQYPLDQTYMYPQIPYLWISILSNMKPGEEEKAFSAHTERYKKMKEGRLEANPALTFF